MLPGFDANQITNLDGARQAITLLLNLVEKLKQENEQLRTQVQQLRDEINRLKGEQGKPDIKPNKPAKAASQHSSEQERRQPKPHRKSSKVNKIEVNREEKLAMAHDQLPADAQFKGYETVVIQDIQLRTDNVRFHKEKYYSPSQHQTYLAALPAGYTGEFGPCIRSLVLTLYFGSEMAEPKIAELLQNIGVYISDGQISNLVIKEKEPRYEETCVEYHQRLLADFKRQFWDYYHNLNAYRADPTPERAVQLEKEFDELFSQVTGYDELDKRIAKTKAKKDRLLKVFTYPEMPLHNNPAELAARRRVRKRDISFGPRTADGVAVWDTFMTPAATVRQLGVSFYAYIYDRVSGARALPDLADIIRQRAPAFHPLPCGEAA